MRVFLVLFSFMYAFGYRVVNYCISPDMLVIREINESKLLTVNTKTLKTYIIPYTSQKSYCNFSNRYFKLINIHPKLINAGVDKSKKPTLTVDLCPSSKKGFDKQLFLYLIKHFKKPVPVTIFITKKWILYHQKEFKLLKKWQKEKKLNITWGNHTATHPYNCKLPINKNFVLIKGYNLKKDVLDLETYLIKNNITPSVFFRFPGLISDAKSLQTIKDLGLIVIGSNGWLAKGEKISKHSIILIHANKNEEKGIKLFIKNSKDLKLFPLNNSL